MYIKVASRARATIAIRARQIGGFIVIARSQRSMTILRNGIKHLSDIYYIGAARYVGVRLEAILATVPRRRIAPSWFFTIDSLSLLAAFVPPRARRYLRPPFVSALRAPNINPHKCSQSQSFSGKLTRDFHAAFLLCPRKIFHFSDQNVFASVLGSLTLSR